jgi:hypothetical protein
MLAAVVCREMKWTWEEYQQSPQRFIDIIVKMLTAEALSAKKRNKK